MFCNDEILSNFQLILFIILKIKDFNINKETHYEEICLIIRYTRRDGHVYLNN